jgi:hypothetical protein
MKPRFKTVTVIVACAGTALCLLLFALQLLPDPESFAYLQEMVAEKGWCSVPIAGDDWIIHADTAKIENDSFILKRNATTGDDSLVVIAVPSGSPVFAKSVSIRFNKDPNDSLELTFDNFEHRNIKTTGSMSMTFERNWSLRKWLAHHRWKLKKVGK